eukprot:g18582.t1
MNHTACPGNWCTISTKGSRLLVRAEDGSGVEDKGPGVACEPGLALLDGAAPATRTVEFGLVLEGIGGGRKVASSSARKNSRRAARTEDIFPHF